MDSAQPSPLIEPVSKQTGVLMSSGERRPPISPNNVHVDLCKLLNPGFKEEVGYTVLALSALLSGSPSFLPSVTNIVHRTFLSNHASLHICYGAFARSPTHGLPTVCNSKCVPVCLWLSVGSIGV